MQLDGGLVQVRLDAHPLGLDPVEVARGAVEAPVVVADVEVVVMVVHVAAAPPLLRQTHYIRKSYRLMK